MTDLNENELKALKSLIASSSGNGHDFGWTDEYDDVGFTKHQMAGYISQLSTKGYLSLDDLSEDPGCACNSVQFLFTLKAEELLNKDGRRNYADNNWEDIYVDHNH